MAAPAGLWASGGWVRGSWPVSMNVWDPSGVCDEQAILNGRLVADVPVGKNQTAWQQCPNNPYLQTVNTAEYGAGAIPLTLKATNAADVSNAYTKTIYVDNQAPTISLSGPHDAPSTAGVQYVTATGSAGPSGVSGVACSLDGSPAQWRAGASMQTAIQGVGVHHLTCWSANDSRDANGVAAVSAPATWTLSIRLPTASAVGFSRLKSGLRCGRERELILVPAHWVTIRRHGKRVKVRRRGHLTTITVVRCHRSHSLGRQTATVVRFGSRTTVNGWLGTAQGVALGGQTIRIFTAADNGQYAFRQVGHARTARDGSWSARIPAGPSRIVRAVFDGGATIEPSGADARVVVPASVRLRISPRHAHWGGTIVISGQLRGGYVPPAGEVLFVRLRYNGKRIEVEHVRTSRDGRFHTTYTFLGGNGVAAYPFWVTTIPESDYPYAAGNSNKVVVTVSP